MEGQRRLGSGVPERSGGATIYRATMNGDPMLCYVDDALPGITRRRCGRYWQYFDAKGARISDRDEIDRLNAIGLPPAYKDAWFCPSPHGHIQAIGYDEKGRKQYRYHEDFRARQEAAKYYRCSEFGSAHPLLRPRVEVNLAPRQHTPTPGG